MINLKRKTRLLLLAALALATSLAITACGGGGGINEAADNSDVSTATGGDPTGSLKISNWPLYIDGKTIDQFSQRTGIDTTYIEDVNENESFFGKVQQQLAQGDSGGRDIMVVTDWMADKMYKLGYLQKLDKSKLKTVEENMLPALQHPAFDPNREFSVPWQSGMVGLVVRKDLAPDVKSVNDLFDPKYKGKVTLLTEMRDTIPVMMKADGIDPEKATKEDWLKEIEKLDKYTDNGQIRRFTGNDYVQDMAKGDVVAALGWSGDTIQAQADNPNIQYVQPSEGCSFFADNMVIPVGAPNPAAAYKFMNYVYEPKNQAQITAYVNYVSPVQGVKEVLQKKSPEIAGNELIFPSDEFTAKCSTQVSPPGDTADVKEVEQAFQNVVTG